MFGSGFCRRLCKELGYCRVFEVFSKGWLCLGGFRMEGNSSQRGNGECDSNMGNACHQLREAVTLSSVTAKWKPSGGLVRMRRLDGRFTVIPVEMSMAAHLATSYSRANRKNVPCRHQREPSGNNHLQSYHFTIGS